MSVEHPLQEPGEHKTVGDGEETHPLPFIVWDQTKRQFDITQEGIEFFMRLTDPIAVISVAGPMRQGKSYIMNRLNGKQDGFPLGSQVLSCTQGSWIWECNRKFVDEDGCPFRVILMDFEGLFDPQRTTKPKRYDLGLMTFACLLSSILVYNIKGNIDSSAIETLQLMTRVVEQLKLKKKKRGNQNKMANYFPMLLWVLRDFFLEMVNKKGKPLTPKEYLDSNLDTAAQVRQTSDSEGSGDSGSDSDDNTPDPYAKPPILTDEEKGLLAIKSLFPDRDLHTLCRPVADEAQLRHLEDVSYTDLKPQFQEQSDALVEKIYKAVKPKRLYDIKGTSKIATGAEFLEYARVILQAYNNNKSLVFDDAWKSVASLSCQRAKSNALSAFVSDLSSLKDAIESGEPVEADELQGCYLGARDNAMNIFVQLAVAGPPSEEFQRSLIEELREHIHNLEKRNLRLSKNLCEKWIEEQEALMKDLIKAKKFDSIENFLQNLETLFGELQGFKELGPWRKESSELTTLAGRRLTDHAMLHFKIGEQEKEMIKKDQEYEYQRTQAEEREKRLKSEQQRMQTEVDQMKKDTAALEKEFQQNIETANKEARERQDKLMQELRDEHNTNIQAVLQTQQKSHENALGRLEKDAKRREQQQQDNFNTFMQTSQQQQTGLRQQILAAQQAAEQARLLAARRRSSSGCFSASSTVRVLRDGSPCQMKITKLVPGDKILSMKKNGNLFYAEVFYCSHMHTWTGSQEKANLLRLECSNGIFIDASENHLIYGKTKSRDNEIVDGFVYFNQEQIFPRRADCYDVGDTVFTFDGSSNTVVPTTVLSKSFVTDKIRAPLTHGGNLFVNGVLASSYVENHNFGHASTLPLRLVHSVSCGAANSNCFELIWDGLNDFRRWVRNTSQRCNIPGKTAAYGVFGGATLLASVSILRTFG